MVHKPLVWSLRAVILVLTGWGVGVAHAGSAEADVLCPPPPILGGIVTAVPLPLEEVGCALGSADVEIVTRLQLPDGTELARRHRTLIMLPTLVNADSDVLPDLVVWPALSSPTHFTVSIDRALFESAPLPVSVELVVDDPTVGGSLPRDRIHLGYDARGSQAPNRHFTDITIGSEPNGDPRITMSTATTSHSPGNRLAIVGGLFDGDSLDRIDPVGGRLQYSPMPANATIDLGIGESYRIGLQSSAPSVLDASVEMVEGTNEKRAKARIDKLPTSLTATYVPGATADQRTVTTAASSILGKVDLSYRETEAGSPLLGAVVRATDMPRNVVVSQTAGQAGSVGTDGAFGSLEFGLANGDPVLSTIDGPYVKLADDGTLGSVAARIDGLERATVDATDVITADVEVAPTGRKPVVLDIDQPDLSVDGRVASLPEHLSLVADLDATSVTYDGHGQGVDEIRFTANQDTPFFARATRLDARLTDLPAAFTFDLRKRHVEPTPGLVTLDGVTATSSAPLGTVEFQATDGSGSALPSGVGSVYVDTPARFAVGARVHEFERVSVLSRLGDWTELGTTVRSGPFTVHVERDDPAVADDAMTVDGTIADLPHVVDLAMRPPSLTHEGALDLETSAPIDAIDVRLEAEKAFLDRDGADPHIVIARVEGVPTELHADLAVSTSGASVVLDRTIEEVEATLTSGPAGQIGGFGNDDSGMYVRALSDQFVAMGRLRDVRELHFAANPLLVKVVSGQSHPFSIDAQVDDPGDSLPVAVIDGEVLDLPAEVTFQQTAAGFQWDASSAIGSVTLTAQNLPGGDGALNDGAVHFADLEIEQVPEHFRINAGAADSGVEAMEGGSFERIFVQVSDAPQELLADPQDAGNLVQLESHDATADDPATFTAFVRVHHLQRANHHAVGGLSRLVDVDFADPDPAQLLVLVDTTDVDLRARVLEPPEWLSLGLDNVLSSVVSWDAASPTDVDLLFTIADVIGGDLRLQNVAPDSTFCVSGSATGCDSEFDYPHGTTTGAYRIPAVFHTYLQTTGETGPVVLNGIFCLKPIWPAGFTAPTWNPVCQWTAPGTTDDFAGAVRNSQHYVTFRNVTVTDFKIDLHAGDSVEQDEDGDPIEDDLIGGYVDIPSYDGRIHYQKNVPALAEERDNESFIDFESLGSDPFTADGWEFVLDVGSAPSQIFAAGDNDCGSDSALRMWVLTQYSDLFELDDLTPNVDLCTD